jgi:molybdopterin-guanine dinucleotide biosynthesis protein A
MASKRNKYDAVLPRIKNHAEPLFAFYSKKLLISMEKAVLTGMRGMKDFLKDKKVKYITIKEIRQFDPETRSFVNLNTPEDVRALD